MNHLIVGASEGIGKELSKQLLSRGETVWAVQRNVADHIPAAQQQLVDVQTDSINLDLIPEEIHGFVFCPGTINLKPFHRMTDEDFKYDYEINVIGAVRCIRALLPKLKAGKASVVLFSSVAAQTGMSFHSSIASAKAAVEALTPQPCSRIRSAYKSKCHCSIAHRYSASCQTAW